MENITIDSLQLFGELYPRKQCDYDVCGKILDLYNSNCKSIFVKNEKCEKVLYELDKCDKEWSQCRRSRYSYYF
jgi:hypothetical protein